MAARLKILVPVDLSVHTRATLDFALSLTELFAADFLLLHVVAGGEVETFATLGGEEPDGFGRAMDEATLRLDAELKRIQREKPQIAAAARVVSGVPFKEICRVAAAEGCHLIVIGTHGRSGLPHLLIGSTAERVVQHAACPVLSIKPQIT